ncbi:hypothetical protein [Limnofasciculus baicalensis]|uniref:Uncharacterized protein n=1 Tax=Limnofasciculus baicalensis BBK-W-15 TaxID=2699891 RepID=A0AAE3GRD1_9CYAN|nr:hypothetical protein [Limnofasciculus baicalensis]MCP2729310.1 hypothetical protein [Limnofasciculus baicalensis BBK-W-15]
MNSVLIVFYFLIAAYLFWFWFNRFKQENTLTNEEKVLCLATFVIGVIFLPIVIPIAYSKLVLRQKERDLDVQESIKEICICLE